MKIIFLDFDGVLNVIPNGFDKYGGIFHENFVENLRYIIEKTGSVIVISAGKRSYGLEYMKKMWKYRNYPGKIIGITPLTELRHRGTEIKMFLDNYTDDKIDNYVIIDDDDDMLDEQMKNFVKTSDNKDHEDCIDIGYGLTKKCAEQSINILNSI